MNPKPPQVKIIAGITGALTIGLAAAAFVLSFNSLTELAAQQGLSVPVLFPLILEGGLIVFSLTALTRSLQNRSTVWQWILVVASSAAAMSFNIIHAPNQTALSRVMWAIPSIMLLLAFENVLSQLKTSVIRAGVEADITALKSALTAKANELSAVQKELDKQSTLLTKKAAEVVQADAQNVPPDRFIIRAAKVQALAAAGFTNAQIADQLELAVSTVKRVDLTKFNGELAHK